MTTPIRVGAVSFTNTVPLIHTLDGPGVPEVALSLAPPAQLAEQMHAGRVDVGLIPVVEHFRAGDYRLITSVGICSRGAVESVMVYCRRPPALVRTLAADSRSRTSVALSRVWFAKAIGIDLRVLHAFDPTRTVPHAHADGDEATDADAVLVIGDANWRMPREGWAEVVDLGRAWHDLTGLGFVYAGWSARPEVPSARLAAVERRLTAAKEAGVAAVRELSRRAAAKAGVTAGQVEHYLTRCIRFDIEGPERRGMELFGRWCGELGLLDRPVGEPAAVRDRDLRDPRPVEAVSP
jgi:chorismate dehydratase